MVYFFYLHEGDCMTNFEHLASDKHALAILLDDEDPIWQKINAWYCYEVCPHRAEKRYAYDNEIVHSCLYDECIDKRSSLEVILMWLDSEYNE